MHRVSERNNNRKTIQFTLNILVLARILHDRPMQSCSNGVYSLVAGMHSSVPSLEQDQFRHCQQENYKVETTGLLSAPQMPVFNLKFKQSWTSSADN